MKPASLKELFSIDVRSLALFRICIGLLILVDLLHRSRDLVAHYTDFGVLPTSAFYEYFSFLPYKLSLHALSGSPYYQGALFIIAGIFAISMIVGYHTRVSTVVTWLFLLSLQDRNVMILYGGDVYLRVMLFWALFLPLGEYYSIDSYRLKEKLPAKNRCSAASVGYLFQICMVYWAAAAFKWNSDWTSGVAVNYALNIDQFATPLGLWLKEQTALLPILTHITLYCELIGPFLAFIPFYFGFFRTGAVVLFTLIHIGFGLCLTLGLFSFIGITAWIPFLPSAFWDQLPFKEKWKEETIGAPFFENVLLSFLIVYVSFYNLNTIDKRVRPPLFGNHWKSLANLLHINQKWNMFSRPLRDDGWYVVEGEMLNGKKIDLFQKHDYISWQKPELVSETYVNDRWRKYMMNIWWKKFHRYRKHYAEYLANDWNAKHSGLSKVKSVRIFFILERTGEDLQPEFPQRFMIEEFKTKHGE